MTMKLGCRRAAAAALILVISCCSSADDIDDLQLQTVDTDNSNNVDQHTLKISDFIREVLVQ